MSLILLPLNTAKTAAIVEISNWPVTQTVDGTVDVGNFPVTQTVDGTVNVGNFPSVQPISDNGGSLTVDSDNGSISTYHKPDYSQLSTAGDPTPPAGNEGATMEYTDTGDTFRWTGTQWIKITIGGSSRMYPTASFLAEAERGNIPGHSIVHKFGKNKAVTATFTPLTIGGIYETPQVAGSTTLRIKAGGNVNDNQTGSGARGLFVQGLGVAGAVVSETLLPHATDGTLAGPAGLQAFMRVFRSYVITSGSYANTTTESHGGDIVVENSGGGTDWLTVDSAGWARSQSQIGVYTVPLGFTAYVHAYTLTTDSNKAVDFVFFKRESILDTAAPYSAMRAVVEEMGIQGEFTGGFVGGQMFPELTDLGWMVKAAAAAAVTVDFEILLIADGY
ncbi:MAG: hypothetical protein KAT62_03630 [Desulfuromonadales bacterium]|nr:hypothetical protein [Desulfuromonadales bacterium]